MKSKSRRAANVERQRRHRARKAAAAAAAAIVDAERRGRAEILAMVQEAPDLATLVRELALRYPGELADFPRLISSPLVALPSPPAPRSLARPAPVRRLPLYPRPIHFDDLPDEQPPIPRQPIGFAED